MSQHRSLAYSSSWVGLLLLVGCISEVPPLEEKGTTGTDTNESGHHIGDETGSSTDDGSSSADESSESGPEDGPFVVRDDVYRIFQGPVTNIPAEQGLLINDDGPALVAKTDQLLTARRSGLNVELDGSFAIEPTPGYWGEDTFNYRAIASNGDEQSGSVRVMVSPVGLNLVDVVSGLGEGEVFNGQTNDRLGSQADVVGDINGDGFDDLVFGADLNTPSEGLGRLYVVFGGASLVTDLSAIENGTGGFVINGELEGGYLGYAMSSADVNGDGLVDILVASARYDRDGLVSPSTPGLGRVYVVFGKTDTNTVDLANVTAGVGGFAIEPRTHLDPPDRTPRVDFAGDVNGDGLDDIVLGYIGFGNNQREEGAYVVFGKTDTELVLLDEIAEDEDDRGFRIDTPAANAEAGWNVDGGGDLNGDGLDDVLIGVRAATPPYLDPPARTGEVDVVFGKRDGGAVALTSVRGGIGGRTLYGESAENDTGANLIGGADINGDGVVDIVVSAPVHNHNRGRVYVVFGSDSTEPLALGSLAEPGHGGFVIDGVGTMFLGNNIETLGDLNGDGYDDMVMSSIGPSRAFVVYGKPDDASVIVSTESPGEWGFFIDGEFIDAGVDVGSGGDVDGDGFDDMAIGATNVNGATLAGRAYIALGGDFGGVVGNARPPSVPITYEGAPDAEVIVGGTADDVLKGGGGRDVIRAGAGDDTIEVPDRAFRKLHGGTGEDTLVIGGQTFDLTSLGDFIIREFERLDLREHGATHLLLSATNIRNLSRSHNTITVLGDADDRVSVDLRASGFEEAAAAGCDHFYTNGVSALCIVNGPMVSVEL